MKLRSQYRTTLMIGLVMSLSLLTGLFRMDTHTTSSPFDIMLAQQEVVQMEDIQQTQQIEKPPPPPRPPVPVEVPDDTILEDEDIDLDATLDLEDALAEIPPPPELPDAKKVQDEEDEIFVVVEQMPMIIGGNSKVYEYLEYPAIARQAGMEGLVVVQIIVNTDGFPESPEIVRSAGTVLDEAAQRAVVQLRFVPGKQRGRAVNVRIAIPIRFRLRDARPS